MSPKRVFPQPRKIRFTFLAGSELGPRGSSPLPAQEPPIPLAQLQPSVAQIKVAEEALEPRFVWRDSKKRPAAPKYRKPLTARKRFGMTRAQVAALLDKPLVENRLPERTVRKYRALANGNTTLATLASQERVSATAMEVIVEGWESDIVAKTCEIYRKFQPRGTDPRNNRDGEKTENESETAQDADVVKTGGGSIGGRIVSGGKDPVTGRSRKVFDFERSGKLRETASDPGYDRSGSQVGEEDDYGEDSRA